MDESLCVPYDTASWCEWSKGAKVTVLLTVTFRFLFAVVLHTILRHTCSEVSFFYLSSDECSMRLSNVASSLLLLI